MTKKSKNDVDIKSTVMNMRDEFDWGKILFDACYIFNYSLAEHWLNYVKNYQNKKFVQDSDKHINEIIETRNKIINTKKDFKENRKKTIQQANIFYKQYAQALPIGSFIKEQRMNNNSVQFQELMNIRKDSYDKYHHFIDENNKIIQEENDYTKNHLFQARTLGTRARTLKKIINIHELELSHPICEDKDIIYNFLISEEQAERLMGVCINILNTYSEKEFSKSMNVQDREKIADNIYEYFSTFEHNYDFITGCYQVGNDNKLYLKDLEKLKSKLYNGYYFTIRGFVQRSYIAARDEKYNITSVDMNWNDEDNHSNCGFDKYTNTEEELKGGYSVAATSAETNGFGEGMKNFWYSCQEYLKENIDEMANELFYKMKNRFSDMNYYCSMTNNQIMVNILLNTLNGISEELKRGKNVSSKLKHIILDSMGGAETKTEWKQCVIFTSDIIMKHINKFFIYNKKELENSL